MARKLRSALALLCALLSFALPASAFAASGLSQGFKTSDPNLPAGSLVSLTSGSDGTVQAATSSHASQLIGVTADQTLVELTSGSAQVQVVVSGTADVLVSDINGDIKVGDKITASPIKGVGMKALVSTQVIGTAQKNFKDVSKSTQKITDRQGKRQSVKVGTLPVQINVSYFAASQGTLSSLVPSFLLSAGTAIAGKDVSPTRVLIGFFCLAIGFVIAGVILQSAVRSGIISLGRNPLAHTILRQSLIDVLVTTLGLLILSAIIFYLILTI